MRHLLTWIYGGQLAPNSVRCRVPQVDRTTAKEMAVTQAIEDLDHIIDNANDTVETVKHLKMLMREFLTDGEVAELLAKSSGW
jgi:hypothetical protein